MAFTLVTVACGLNDSTSTPSTSTEEPTASPSPAPAEPLVGEWQRLQKCLELARGLKQAGLEEFIAESVVGSEFIAGVDDVSQLPDPANPCKGAEPRLHSHFFTEDGEFGSLNEFGKQVDDGTYELVNDRTFILGDKLTFHFRIKGDTIMFDPVIPQDCSTKKCFGDAVYMVGVSYPGERWERVG
jgi:hypothetical protein